MTSARITPHARVGTFIVVTLALVMGIVAQVGGPHA